MLREARVIALITALSVPTLTYADCPAFCHDVGPVPSNWTILQSLDQVHRCSQMFFLDFSLDDNLDEEGSFHRIRACTTWGDDWDNVAATASTPLAATAVNGTYEIGWQDSATTRLANPASLISLVSGMQTYFTNGYGLKERAAIMFGVSEGATVGLYLGKALQNEGTAIVPLQTFLSALYSGGITGSVSMQYCGGGLDGDHTFGIVASLEASLASVQGTVQTWAKAQCLGNFSRTTNITDSVFVTAPPLIPTSGVNNTVSSNAMTPNGTVVSRRNISNVLPRCKRNDQYQMNTFGVPNLVDASNLIPNVQPLTSSWSSVQGRAFCTSIQVAPGDSCGSLATKCGITGALITVYNSAPNFCAALVPFQHICCSAGTLPSFAPAPNSDGSCSSYTTVPNDNCYTIAAQYSLTVANIESFNSKTWAWNGCSNLWVGVKICLSTGAPPMPAAVANSVCGPQVPGTTQPAAGVDLSTLNPCPLNACCDVWGQCGTTTEFCTDTSTGPPGTAKPGTNGCISNCGTSLVRSAAPATFMKVAFFQGYNLARSCLNMDVRQVDKSKYTHIHFAFATLTSDYAVVIGDTLSTYEFNAFVGLTGVKRILSIGGWTFSTTFDTYTVFRDGVSTSAKQTAMATSIANFIIANNLDGVDIDWEYPGAPDIPGIPAASTIDGANYLAFLTILKSKLPGKTVSICAPASYWYLKGYPIKSIGSIVDYIVYMTYDLHGQWDYGNQWSDPGCPGGNCLRSHVNLTETMDSLVMITKAGVPSNKIVVGVSSYGRAFKMTSPGCTDEKCTYTGPASGATPGSCTGTAGYISNAEINAIAAAPGVNAHYLDAKSQTNVLVFNDVQWIGYMSDDVKLNRTNLYQTLNMGGVADWAVDMQTFQPAPAQPTWIDFKHILQTGGDGMIEGTRTGNWTTLTCSSDPVVGLAFFSPAQRWGMLDANDAWNDALTVWKTIDKPGKSLSFGRSIANTFHAPESSSCEHMLEHTNCDQTIVCAADKGSGPAAFIVWNSLVMVHEMLKNYYDALLQMTGILNFGWQKFLDDFAPLPPPDDATMQIIIELLGLGGLMVAAPFFNSYLASMPYFLHNVATLNNLRDTSYALIAATTGIIKDLDETANTQINWTAKKQANFAAYVGQAIWGWANVTEFAAGFLFSGSDEGIAALTNLISDGKLSAGRSATGPAGMPDVPPSSTLVQTSIETAYYAFTIPLAWVLSGTNAFILDSGYKCGSKNPLKTYLSVATGEATWACYQPPGGQNNMYYIVYPKGKASTCTSPPCGPSVCNHNTFSAPKGLEKLDGHGYGGITKETLIAGSVRTYTKNGNKNGGPAASITDPTAVDDLYKQDVTTPGYIRLPVCNAAEAWANWLATKGEATYATYPCNNVTMA